MCILQAISNGSMMDVIEMDAASNRGIDDVRDLREKVNLRLQKADIKYILLMKFTCSLLKLSMHC
jgi:DNA polymerase-3 subunit gamma/tau